MMPEKYLTIIMPALDEEKNILQAIDTVLGAFKEFNIKGELIVVDDGSVDSTPVLIKQRMGENTGLIRMINHPAPMGIGASFWDGVDNAAGDFVCMLPGDNENEPREILRYFTLMEDVDMVIPFVFNKGKRTFLRNILSFLYIAIVNATFRINLHYTNGTVLYRKSLLKSLNRRRNDFFYQTDILVRLIKRGYLFAEVPYRLRSRKGGESKALSLRSLRNIIRGYFKLMIDIYIKKSERRNDLTPASVSKNRFNEINTAFNGKNNS